MQYNRRAAAITAENPKWTESTAASTAEITDAHPFTPHAHGISSGAFFPTCARASGNGMPMQKESGATSMIEMRILAQTGSVIKAEKSGSSVIKYDRPRITMATAADSTAPAEPFFSANRFECLLPRPAKNRNAVGITAAAYSG